MARPETESMFEAQQKLRAMPRDFFCPQCGATIAKPDALDMANDRLQAEIAETHDPDRATVNCTLVALNLVGVCSGKFEEAMTRQEGDAFACPRCSAMLSVTRAWDDQYVPPAGPVFSPLDRIFDRIQSGDIQPGRSALLRMLEDSACPLDALCLGGMEFTLPPDARKQGVAFYTRIKERFPDSIAADCLLFSVGTNKWIDLQSVCNISAELNHADPPAGPHEAALRIFAGVASTSAKMIIANARPDTAVPARITNADSLLIGVANLRVRDPEKALHVFREGFAKAENRVAHVRESLGRNYEPASPDGGRFMWEVGCRFGEFLALRDLGRRREALGVLKALDETFDMHELLAPLVDECRRLVNQPPYPLEWRAKLNRNS